MIEQQTVDAAVEFVRAIGQGSWSNIRWEHQDGGESLLVAVSITDALDFEISESRRLAILDGLGRMIPTSGKVHGPNWMVVFLRDSKVFDSIYGEFD